MISVCMLSFNGANYIKEQLDSILCQLNPEDEVIISDDGSTDNTLDIVLAYNDSRIRLLNHKLVATPFSGVMDVCYRVGRNAENALKNAKGDYIFLADQDDVWPSDKVEKCIRELQNVDLIVTNKLVVDSNMRPLSEDGKAAPIKSPTLYNTLTHTPFTGCCMAFRKSLLNYILPFPEEPLMHDIWIGLMGMKHGKVRVLQEPLLFYRRHGGNASINGTRSKNPLSYKLKYRYYLLKAYLMH